MRHTLFILILLLSSVSAMGQQESANVRKGNKAYKAEKYTEAEVEYRRGLEKNDKGFEAHYNLVNSLFKQQKYPEAI